MMGDMQAGESSQTAVQVQPSKYYRAPSKKPFRKRVCEKPKQYLWIERTKLERALLILFTVSIIVIIALSITVNVLNLRDVTSYCVTKDCVNSGAYILNSMDRTKDPCDDFYKFACGNFIEETIAPEKIAGQDSLTNGINSFTKKQEIFYARIISILENKNELDPKSLWKARRYYESCMNEDKINELGLKPMKELLDVLGGWPLISSDWTESDFSWNETMVRFYDKGLDIPLFMAFTITPDYKNSEYFILAMDKPNIGYPHENERHFNPRNFNDSQLLDYYYFMVNTSVLFGANRTVAEIECRKVMEFEASIVEKKNEERSPEQESRINVNSVQGLIPAPLDWMKLFGHLLPFQMTGTEQIYIEYPGFVSKQLGLFYTTPKQTVANYMMWQAVRKNLELLGDAAKDLVEKYESKRKIDDSKPRWFYCLNHVWKEMLSPAAMYVRRYLHPHDKEKVNTLFVAIRDELKQLINYHNGFNYDTRKQALENLDSMNHFVFPDEFLKDDSLEDYYQDLQLNEDEYFHNVLTMRRFLQEAKFREIKYSRKNPHWTSIYYQLALEKMINWKYDENIVGVPFTFLAGYNFESDRPEYANYGSLGPALGTFILSSLNTDYTDILLGQKEQCAVAQLGSVRGTHTNTIKAVIAVAAVQLAYKTYQNWVYYNGGEKNLPGLKYTPSQMFWIVDATQMCGNYPDESSLTKFSENRVNGPFSGLSEFSKDFQCGEESKMNRKDKCDVW